jgi:ubiquinone/menaquinone biosynthesis C-methylase UbiE
LEWALRSGCSAKAIDHSPEMVHLASERNAEAIGEGRLQVLESEAERLPFADGEFTCAAMTNVFFFLYAPAAVLAEVHRVLADDGRLAIYTAGHGVDGPAADRPADALLRRRPARGSAYCRRVRRRGCSA